MSKESSLVFAKLESKCRGGCEIVSDVSYRKFGRHDVQAIEKFLMTTSVSAKLNLQFIQFSYKFLVLNLIQFNTNFRCLF